MMIDVDFLLDQAFACFNSGDLESAEDLLNQVQRILPTHGDLLYLKGLIALKKKMYSQAKDFLSMAVKLYPKKEAYQEALADVYQGEKNYDKAKEIYTNLKPTEAVHFKLALIEKETGHLSTARQMFKDLLLTPEASSAAFELAFMEGADKKLSYLIRSFELNPNEKNATEIVKVLLSNSSFQNLDKYLKYIDNEYTLACVDVALNQYESALQKLENYVKKFAYDEVAWLLLGQVYEKLKNPSKAEQAYQKLLALNPNSFDGNQGIAKLLMGQGRFSEALNHYQITCRIQPENKEILLAMALLTAQTKNYDESLGLCFRLLTLGQKGLSGLIQKNILRLSRENKDLAKDFAKGWVKSFPQSKVAQNLLKKLSIILIVFFFSCSCYANLTQDEKHWQILWESKMAESGDPVSLYYLGELFEQGKKVPKDLNRAIHYYEKSARQSYLPACIKLGQLFASETPLKDEKKSLEWYLYAADKGDIQSEFYVADYYQQYKHRDYPKAQKYLEMALKQTFPKETDFSKVSPQYADLMKKIEKNNTLSERKTK